MRKQPESMIETARMIIEINGEKKEWEKARSLAEMIHDLGYEGARIAVARNDEFVPRSDYATVQLRDGDRLEIVSPMQGG